VALKKAPSVAEEEDGGGEEALCLSLSLSLSFSVCLSLSLCLSSVSRDSETVEAESSHYKSMHAHMYTHRNPC
jgi:hypothetical protein